MAVVAVSMQRETASSSAPGSALLAVEREPVSTPPPLTAEEEAFTEALWPLHQEVVEASSGRLTFAGLAFVIDDHDADRLGAKLTPLRQTFHDTQAKVAAIPAPSSLQRIRDRYVGMLSLYELSATEMLKVAQDGDEGHLVDAQRTSEQAAEELVRLGDMLWPGEHKPN